MDMAGSIDGSRKSGRGGGEGKSDFGWFSPCLVAVRRIVWDLGLYLAIAGGHVVTDPGDSINACFKSSSVLKGV